MSRLRVRSRCPEPQLQQYVEVLSPYVMTLARYMLCSIGNNRVAVEFAIDVPIWKLLEWRLEKMFQNNHYRHVSVFI